MQMSHGMIPKSVIVLTGASRGLGSVLARALAESGARLVLAARSEYQLESLRQALLPSGAEVHVVRTDLTQESDRQALIEYAEQTFGHIDVLINNAGLFVAGELEHLEPHQIDEVLTLNLEAPIALCARVLPGMLRRGTGHIINIASIGGMLPVGWGEIYAATKHGLLGFTRSLDIRLKVDHPGVCISAVCPGFIEDIGMYADQVDANRERPSPLLRPCQSQDVANAVLRTLQDKRLERIVNTTPVRPLVIIGAISATLGSWLTRWLGLHDFIQEHFAPRSSRQMK